MVHDAGGSNIRQCPDNTSMYEALTMDKFMLPRDTNVSPLAQSMPNIAQMSPAYTSCTS